MDEDDVFRMKRAIAAIGGDPDDWHVDPVLFAQAIREADRISGWDKRRLAIVAEAKAQGRSGMAAISDAYRQGIGPESGLALRIYHQLLMEKAN